MINGMNSTGKSLKNSMVYSTVCPLAGADRKDVKFAVRGISHTKHVSLNGVFLFW